MRIVFMGTPEFSIPTLQRIIDHKDHDIIACYSREPSIANRGKKITKSPIHQFSDQHNIKVLTPKTLKSSKSQDELKALNPDIIVVVAYGLILPQEILDIPKYGCINIHPSLLPKWRGAAPIQRPIMNGENKTGVVIIKMDSGLDSGDMINQSELNITKDDDYLNISEKLSHLGADLLIKSLEEIKNNSATYTKQDSSQASYAHKLRKEECEINCQESAQIIHNKIRGLRGTLSAYFMLNNEKIKIHQSKILNQNSKENPLGTIGKNFEIQCNPGIIQPQIIQRPGKKPLLLKEFLLGNNPKN